MAESKFTKGPLTATQNDTVKGLWDVRSDRDFLGVAFDESAQSNAELWADAPRLLEALRGIRDAENNAELYLLLELAEALLEKHGG